MGLPRLTSLDNITPLKRAAIFVMYLQPTAARKLLAELDDDEVKSLARTMSELGEVDQELVEDVVDSFLSQLGAASYVATTGQDFARRFLPDLLSADRKEQISSTVRLHNQAAFEAFVRARPPRAVAAALVDEHPQVQAVAMLRMGVENAARVLGCFPEETQTDLTIRMTNVDRVAPEFADDIEAAIRAAIVDVEEPLSLGGIDRTARILGRLPTEQNNVVLREVRMHSEELADDLIKKMVRFEDLERMDNRSMQALLRALESTDVVVALRGASASLRDKILANVSQRAAADLKEELEIGAPIRRQIVREAQERITAIARRLADEGVIFLDIGESGAI